MTAIALLDKKKRGLTHDRAELFALVQGVQSGQIPDYQLAAWLMAATIQGLNLDETVWLTEAFVQSGRVLQLEGLPGPVIDKHSTGGVGDKTTLVLVPLLAAVGAIVPKLSGRGLGFTGGTIDKLEAIAGFRTRLSAPELLAQLQRVGAAISSQTQDLAPADAQFYALRDVTATVDSLPLIAASVVSKKIAAGAETIVLDIKYGRGAFMKTLVEARQLARLCREVGLRLDRKLETILSSMEEPLGCAVGHSLEVVEAVQTLKGQGPADVTALCLHLGGLALVAAGLATDIQAAEQRLRLALSNGEAYQKFVQLVVAQGGDKEVLEDPSLLPQPERISFVPSPESGFLAGIDSLAIAKAVKVMGGGRQTKTDQLDLSVGVVLHKKVGDWVDKGETLLEIHASHTHYQQARELVESAYSFSSTAVPAPMLLASIDSVVI